MYRPIEGEARGAEAKEAGDSGEVQPAPLRKLEGGRRGGRRGDCREVGMGELGGEGMWLRSGGRQKQLQGHDLSHHRIHDLK